MSCVLAGTEILFPVWILHHVSRSELSVKAALCFDVTSTGFFSGIEITQVQHFFVKIYTRLVFFISCRVETVTFSSGDVCFILTVATYPYIPGLVVAFILVFVIQHHIAGVFSVYPSADYSVGIVKLIFYP